MISKKLQAVLEGKYRVIPLRRHKVTIVDPDDYDKLSRHKWFAKKHNNQFYACRKVKKDGKEHLIRMHRVVTNCPNNLVPHHKNGLTLDNRKRNLVCLTKTRHDTIQKNFLDTA